MSDTKDSVSAPKQAWEQIIKAAAEQGAAAVAAGDPPAKIKEMTQIKQFMIDA